MYPPPGSFIGNPSSPISPFPPPADAVPPCIGGSAPGGMGMVISPPILFEPWLFAGFPKEKPPGGPPPGMLGLGLGLGTTSSSRVLAGRQSVVTLQFVQSKFILPAVVPIVPATPVNSPEELMTTPEKSNHPRPS